MLRIFCDGCRYTRAIALHLHIDILLSPMQLLFQPSERKPVFYPMRTINNRYTRLPNRQNPPFSYHLILHEIRNKPIIPKTTDEPTWKTFMKTSIPQFEQSYFSKADATTRSLTDGMTFDRYH